jgi:hypothetical protein
MEAPTTGPLRFLVLDDNPDDRAMAIRALRLEFPDLIAREASERTAFEEALAGGDFDVVVTDFKMGWTDGIKVLRAVKERSPDVPVIMFTATGNQDIAVEAMKAGLDDYVIKAPRHYARLPIAVQHAIERCSARKRRKALEEDLRAQTAALRESDRRKDELLAMLAHELRNPLSPIRSAAHLIRLKTGGAEDTALRDACGVIERQVDALSRMVDDLLDVSRVSRGKIQLHLEVVDVAAAVSRAIEVAGPLVEAKRQDLRVEMLSEPLRVSADPTRLTQVLANLLTNASKFTPERGRIEISSLARSRAGRARDRAHAGEAPRGAARRHGGSP